MGRDLTLYPGRASRLGLKSYLEGLGFRRCKHLWDWPADTLNYSWFDEHDFTSIDGVSADIYPVSAKEAEISGNGWALHVRNLYSASWHDVKMLNDVLRGAKKLFGGTIKGDYGTDRYAPLWKDESTPISRGIASVYQHVDRNVRAVKFALPQPAMRWQIPEPMDAKTRQLFEYIQRLDPARVIYNRLVPFAVSMFEYFFSRAFRILITYDTYALKKRASHTQRVEFPTLLQVSCGQSAVEDVIANAYTFQNLGQLNKAFKEWLDIDVRKIFFKKKRIDGSISFLERRIADIIQYRHGVVHRFELDGSRNRERYIAILDAVAVSINEFVAYLEKKYAVKIDRVQK